MKYLLDTNVVSTHSGSERNRPVELWAASVPVGDQFVSAFTIAEIERGVIARERSDVDQGTVLRRWLEENVLPTFATGCCRSTCRRPGSSRPIGSPERAPFDDFLIAAVAESAQMTIATRNTEHFESLGVPCLNLWDTTAPGD